jgi:predicted site-specific integrase-resolvase
MNENKNHVTITKAAEMLGKSRKTIHKWIDIGFLEKIVVGLEPRIKISEIERVLKNLNQ